MCGIAGIAGVERRNGQELEHAVFNALSSMAHRGPDGDGVYSDGGSCQLGHRRLSIIDVSENGRQPMQRDGVCLVYNGELYNFREEMEILKSSGVKFRGHSDAEVLLELYLKYGERCLEHLRGMYAFAIWDSRERKLFCARDPLGIKPFLYYETREGGIVFASELKGLLATGLVPKELDRDILPLLLHRGSTPQPLSMIQGVRWLLPGEALRYQKGKAISTWSFKTLKAGTMDIGKAPWNEIVELGKGILSDALERQMVADVPLGAFLSGGLDSSLLVALMSRIHGDVRTFSVGFEENLASDSEDECDDAALVARHLGVSHRKLTVTGKEIAGFLPEIGKALDHPSVDGVNYYFISKMVSSELKVAISGTGGDELFAGYPWFETMQRWSGAGILDKFGRMLSGDTFERQMRGQYFIFDEAAVAALCPGSRLKEWRLPDPLRKADPLSRVTGMLLSGYTRDQLLADIDTTSMWHGLEVRVPLLDESLLTFALSLPEWAKLGPGDAAALPGSYAASGVKRLLLEMARPLLPPDFPFRRKRGFSLPFEGWLKGCLSSQMEELLSEDTVRSRGFFEPAYARRIMGEFRSGERHWSNPWLLMITELWAREALDA